MPTPTIKIDQPMDLGTAGQSRSDLLLGEEVTLSDPANTGPYTWALTAKPPGSTAALSSTSVASPTFTPDLPGTYLVEVTSNGNASFDVVAGDGGNLPTRHVPKGNQGGAAVRHPDGSRVPAQGETTQFGSFADIAEVGAFMDRHARVITVVPSGGDDSAAIAAALLEASELATNDKGCVVQLVPGTYTVGRTAPNQWSFEGYHGVTLAGASGFATVINMTGDVSQDPWRLIYLQDCSDIVLRDLVIDGTGITDPHLTNDQVHGIEVNKGSARVRIERCRFQNFDYNGAGDGIRLLGDKYATSSTQPGWVEDVSIIGCEFVNLWRSGVSFQRYCRRVVIDGCHFHGTIHGQWIDFEPSGWIFETDSGSDGDTIVDANVKFAGTYPRMEVSDGDLIRNTQEGQWAYVVGTPPTDTSINTTPVTRWFSSASGLTVTVDREGETFTRASGSFLADGFKPSQTVTWSGFTGGFDPGSNNITKAIESIDPTGAVMKFNYPDIPPADPDDNPLADEAGTGNEAVQGAIDYYFPANNDHRIVNNTFDNTGGDVEVAVTLTGSHRCLFQGNLVLNGLIDCVTTTSCSVLDNTVIAPRGATATACINISGDTDGNVIAGNRVVSRRGSATDSRTAINVVGTQSRQPESITIRNNEIRMECQGCAIEVQVARSIAIEGNRIVKAEASNNANGTIGIRVTSVYADVQQVLIRGNRLWLDRTANGGRWKYAIQLVAEKFAIAQAIATDNWCEDATNSLHLSVVTTGSFTRPPFVTGNIFDSTHDAIVFPSTLPWIQIGGNAQQGGGGVGYAVADYFGDGVPTFAAPDGSTARRRDGASPGILYVMQDGVWRVVGDTHPERTMLLTVAIAEGTGTVSGGGSTPVSAASSVNVYMFVPIPLPTGTRIKSLAYHHKRASGTMTFKLCRSDMATPARTDIGSTTSVTTGTVYTTTNVSSIDHTMLAGNEYYIEWNAGATGNELYGVTITYDRP